MGKHRDRAKKQKARAHGRSKRYGTDSYDTEYSDQFSGEDRGEMSGYEKGAEEDASVVEYIREQSSGCGRAASTLFCLGSFLMAATCIYLATTHAPGRATDCGERNPLNVSYYNWLIVFGVSLCGVFVLQLLVVLLGCCTKPDWEGDLPPDPKELKMGARRIACASFVIMIFGVLLLLWLVYGCYVFSAPIDVFHNGTKIAPNRWNEKLFASPDCFALHQEGFWLEVFGTTYILAYILSRCMCGIGFTKTMSILEPALT